MGRLYNYFDVEGGTQDLSGYGFPEVHKFDASSFYNWEEDNLPVLDLEKRSEVFRQYLGLNTSLTGVTITVSANAAQSASDSGVFPTIQEALKIVPRTLNFPLLIEICDFGDLGELELADIQPRGAGALQITCRQFTQDVSGTASNVGFGTKYGPSAVQTVPQTVSSPTLIAGIVNASSTKLALSCSSSDMWNTHARVYSQKTPNSQDEPQTPFFAPFPRRTSETFWLTGNTFQVMNYSNRDETSVSADVMPVMKGNSDVSLIEQRENLESTQTLSVAAYGSYFRKISVTNCTRVKLQNICVDSASGADWLFPLSTQYLCDTGIKVKDSNILLDNVSVSRFNKFGIYAENSIVNSTKDLNVFRIYERTVNQTRVSDGVGVQLIDSTLAFDDVASTSGGLYVASVSKCKVGINSINSTIAGGTRSSVTTDTYPKNAGRSPSITGDTETTHLYVSHCNDGILLENSVLDYDGRLEVYCNLNAISSRNSSITTPQFSIDYNQGDGVSLSNSSFRYGKFYDIINAAGSCSASISAEKPKYGYTCDMNGVNFRINNGSIAAPVEDCSAIQQLDVFGGSWVGTGYGTLDAGLPATSHGAVDISGIGRLPGIIVNNGSTAEVVHLGYVGRANTGGLYGACILSDRNSSTTLRGTRKSSTCIGSYGPLSDTSHLRNNWTTAATAATNNSNLSFTGPTKIGRYGVAVLGDSNSTVDVSPGMDVYGGVPDVIKYDLDNSGSHTNFDVHASRACMVVNNKSTLNMTNLGGSAITPSASVDPQARNGTAYGTSFWGATSASYVRFSPNGFTENAAGSNQVEAAAFNLFGRTSPGLTNGTHPQATTGGMVCRAVGASKVNLNLVNIEAGLDNSQTSGIVYNYYGTGCEYGGDVNRDYGVDPSPTSDLCASIEALTCCTTMETSFHWTTPSTTQWTSSQPVSSTTLSSTELPYTFTTWETTTVTVPTETTSVATPSTTQTPTSTLTHEPPSTITTVSEITPEPPDRGGGDGPPDGVQVDSGGLYNNVFGSTKDGHNREFNLDGNDPDSICTGTQIHMWNIADTSRIHAANLLLNQVDPRFASLNNTWHGPMGRWKNGAAADYYGRFGVAASSFDVCAQTFPEIGLEATVDGFYNLGPYRILGSHRGFLKLYSEVNFVGDALVAQYNGGGSPMDQVGAQGYQIPFDTATYHRDASGEVTRHINQGAGQGEPVFGRGLAGEKYMPGTMNGLISHAAMAEGRGMLWDLGQLHPRFPVPPLHLDWQGYLRNFLDESAANVFANARHASSKQVNLLSIYRSTVAWRTGGEGRDALEESSPTFGVGVKSLNMFSLDRLL